MGIEKQVCSLELSKRLKELNVKQESLFYWVKIDFPKETWSTQHIVKKWPEYFLVSKELEKNVYLDKDYEDKDSICSYGCGCCGWEMDVLEKYSAFTLYELIEIYPGLARSLFMYTGSNVMEFLEHGLSIVLSNNKKENKNE